MEKILARIALVLGCALLLGPGAALAEGESAPQARGFRLRGQETLKELRKRFGFRFSPYISMFISTDQVKSLGFNRFGVLGDMSVGVTLVPWLTVELGATGGAFLFTKDVPPGSIGGPDFKPTGGVLAPTLGARVHATSRQLAPFFALSGGPAFTGDLIRPLVQANVGIDIGVGRGVSVGPYFGYGRVIQKNGLRYTTDAGYLSVGLTVAYRPLPLPPPRVITRHTVERVVERVHTHTQAPAPEPPVTDEELDQLLDDALPPAREDRMELLAPVLFAFDSDALEPVGVAMLHEVASLLKSRPDIELLAILGFADKRGKSEYNRELSTRRAERVRRWLIEHGIAPERLTVQTQGASGFVEEGDSEAEHEQNRRVVFRVLRLGGPR